MVQLAGPKVSVLVTVFNHESYIRQCLDSIVCQITDFKFEIVIGEDSSTDNTRQIVVEYASKYPDLIFPILYEKNQGSKKCPGKGNFVNSFYKCKGEFIVHIEGDDYLTDNNKLQLQHDYLIENQRFSACFHNAMVVYDDGSLPAKEMNPISQKTEILPDDLLYDKEVWFMATASVMFRRKLIPLVFPEWFLNSKSGDIPLYCVLSSQGPIGYISKNMCVYRKHQGGLSMTDIHHDAVFINNRISMYNAVNEYTDFKYSYQIKKIISKYYLNLSDSIQYKNNSVLRFYCTIKSLMNYKNDSVFNTIKKYGISPHNYEKYLQFRRFLNRIIKR